jgi:hypothetical protein
MKQNLYINQIHWFRKETKKKIENLSSDKEQGFVTEFGYKQARSRLNGSMQALDLDFRKDINEQIMSNIVMYQKAEKDIKINVLDKNDPNTGLFYLIGGAITQSLILLTAYDNPQSCCPSNKEILLGNSINKLEEGLQYAMKAKDKKVISELKIELGIITKQYQDNLLQMKKTVTV